MDHFNVKIAHCATTERTAEVEKSLKLGTPPATATTPTVPPQLSANSSSGNGGESNGTTAG